MMGRPLVGLAAGAFLIASPAVSQLRSSPPPQRAFRATTEVVQVAVAVTRGRNPVSGLTAADFALTDNGVPQQVDAVMLEGQQIDVSLVMGALPETQEAQLYQGREAVDRMRQMLGSGDRIRIVSAGGEVRERAMRPAGTPFAWGAIVTTAGMSLHDALFYALAWPADADRRHLVVVFSDGNDTWSTLDAERLPDIASRTDAVLHAVLYSGPPAIPDSFPAPRPPAAAGDPPIGMASPAARMPREVAIDWQKSYRALDTAVQRTGGALHVIADRAAAFAGVLADFRSSYVLRYTPHNVAAHGWHTIAVKVTRPGSFTIRARRGYER